MTKAPVPQLSAAPIVAPPCTESPISVVSIIENCLGCKWTLHVLIQVRSGICRPGRLERSAEGLTAKVLAERLSKLVRFGILEKTSFPEVPPRVEYNLTPFGTRLMDIIDQVHQLQLDWSGPMDASNGADLGTAPDLAP